MRAMVRIGNSRSAGLEETAVQPRKWPQQKRSQQMVEAILEAAARVLGSRGYAAATTNQVAVCAGISVGSLYQYFPNKAALAVTLYARHRQRLAEAVARAVEGSLSLPLAEGIARLVAAMWEEHRSHQALHQVLELEFPAQRFAPGTDAVRFQVERLLTARRAEIPWADPERSSVLVLGIIRGLVHAAILDQDGAWDPFDAVQEIGRAAEGYLLLGGAGGPTEAGAAGRDQQGPAWPITAGDRAPGTRATGPGRPEDLASS